MSTGGQYGEPWFKACGTGGEAQVLKYSLELVTTLAATNGKHEEATRIVQCVNACAGMEDPEKEIADLRAQNTSLFRLLADIRAAAGDPSGRLMQDELVDHIRQLHEARATWALRESEYSDGRFESLSRDADEPADEGAQQ